MKVGFIGLGTMGEPMAANLIKGGMELTVNDIRKELKEKFLQMGAKWADTPKEVAQASEVVMTSLPRPNDVEQVILGKDGVLAGAKKSDVLIDLSTNTPAVVRKIAEAAKAKGIAMLDAPVSGGVRGARQGALTIMVGGDEATFAKCQPLLKLLGEKIFLVGQLGAGTVAKLVNNLLALGNVALACEGMVFGVKSGVDPMKLFNVIDASTGTSYVFKGMFPYIIFKGKFEPPSFALSLGRKDLKLVMDVAEEMALPSPVGHEVLKTYERAEGKGLGNQDIGAIITLLEKAAGLKVRVEGVQATPVEELRKDGYKKMEVINLARREARIGPVGKRSIAKIVASGEHFTVVQAEFPYGARSEEHVRENEEAIFVLTGEMTIEFPDLEPGTKYVVPAGSSMYLPPKIKHRHTNSGNEAMKMIVIFSPVGPETKAVREAPIIDVSKL